MNVVFDSSFLVAVLEPQVGFGAAAGDIPEDEARHRLQSLIRKLEAARSIILVPTPVLAEIMVKRSPARAGILQALQRSSRFQIAEFGAAAAFAAADLIHRHMPKPSDRRKDWSRHRLKFDLQVLAIAQVLNAEELYTTDTGLAGLARREGIRPITFLDLPKPPAVQSSLKLPPPGPGPAGPPND